MVHVYHMVHMYVRTNGTMVHVRTYVRAYTLYHWYTYTIPGTIDTWYYEREWYYESVCVTLNTILQYHGTNGTF
jgi:hypothetical protein